MTAYGWRGNVRELENVIQRALILAPGDCIDAGHLCLPRESAPVATSTQANEEGADLRSLERQHILNTLAAAKGVRKVAAERLGMSERTLRPKLQHYREEGLMEPKDGGR